MSDVIDLLKNQFFKMGKDHSLLIGVISGITLAIPKWVTSKSVSIEHGVLIGILITMFFLDYLAGSRLAKKSPVTRKESNIIIDCIIRDFIILVICVVSYGVDYLLGTGAIAFTAFTVAFIYQNLYSFIANVGVLGWEKYFPLWLFKWLQDEILAKKEKYFPTNGKDDE